MAIKRRAHAHESHSHHSHHKTSKGLAIAALLLNVLLLPGLGSIVGGKTTEGIIQLVLTLVGIPLSIFLVGIPLIIVAWVWALITGIQILQESE